MINLCTQGSNERLDVQCLPSCLLHTAVYLYGALLYQHPHGSTSPVAAD